MVVFSWVLTKGSIGLGVDGLLVDCFSAGITTSTAAVLVWAAAVVVFAAVLVWAAAVIVTAAVLVWATAVIVTAAVLVWATAVVVSAAVLVWAAAVGVDAAGSSSNQESSLVHVLAAAELVKVMTTVELEAVSSS